MKTPIYLDHAATTPLDPKVVSIMTSQIAETDFHGNASSSHFYGKKAKEVIENARAQVASLINADASEIVWTSGATESNNLAIKGIASLYQNKGKHIITTKIEHKAVLDVCQHLEKNGFRITYIAPDANGFVEPEAIKNAICNDTLLVSVMHVNNETGVMQNIPAIAEITAARNIFLHVDAAQSAGKIAINVKRTPIDMLSVCAHKIYGPKGVGALYLRKKPRVRVEPLLHGGGHEQGMRSGTLATHQIVGMGAAFQLAKEVMQRDYNHAYELQKIFLSGLKKIPNLKINADRNCCVPFILNLRFENMLADALLNALPNIAASTASACQGKGIEGSYVLRAMGMTQDQIKSSIRFSFGRYTTKEDIHTAVTAIYELFKHT